jgi:hypothetical protein
VLIVAKHKFFESGWSELVCSTPILEPLPPHTDRRIYADQEEERPPKQGINYCVVPDICCDPSLLPSQRDEVE